MPGSVGGARTGHPTASDGRAAALLAWVRARVTPPAGETEPIRRRTLSDTTRPWRGGIVAFVGGVIIVLVAMTVSSGWFNFGVAERGQVIGLIICALALTSVSAPQSSPLLGAGIVVAGVVSFPIGLGGLIVGALLAVVGGGLVAAWQLPPKRAVLRVIPAPAWSRLGAFAIDLILLIGVSLFLRGVADDAVGKNNPILFVLPLTVWAVTRAWCGSRYGWTPGRLFIGLRLRDARTGAPPSFRIAFVREIALLLGVVVGAAVVSKGFDLLFGKHGEVNVVLLNVIAIPLAVAALLLLGRRRLPHDRLLRTAVTSQRVVLGPVQPAKRTRTRQAPSRGPATA